VIPPASTDFSPASRPFLTGRWSHLFLATFIVPPELLVPQVPQGLELDTRGGQAFASLVWFDFADVHVLGVPWPGFRSFPEMNLRFYVRRGKERGVVFVRELVPQPVVAWIARRVYNEPYVAAPMFSAVTEEPDSVRVEHRLVYGGRTHTMRVVGDRPAIAADPASTAAFFKEHHWGYGKDRKGRTLRYRVEHPVWAVYPVREFHIDLEWAIVYGPDWAALQGAQPVSTILAEESPIAVYPRVQELAFQGAAHSSVVFAPSARVALGSTT
jgi:uncharacterized protein YqjF (DUF2071 family)